MRSANCFSGSRHATLFSHEFPASMIGVSADEADYEVVREFFELFKTPWEFYRPGATYDVLLCASAEMIPTDGARLVLRFGAKAQQWDEENQLRPASLGHGRILRENAIRFPVHGPLLGFRCENAGGFREEQTGGCATATVTK